MNETPLDDLADRFSRRAITKDEWSHATHLSVGAWHVHTFGRQGAIERLRIGIRTLNDHHGTPNTETSGYHETITVAYVVLIDQFLSAFEADVPIERRVSPLVNSRLADKTLLLRFWSQSLLMSPTARAVWTPPDLMPLTLPSDAMPLR